MMSCKANTPSSPVEACMLCNQTDHDFKSCAAYNCLIDNYKNCLDIKMKMRCGSCIRGNYSEILNVWKTVLENSKEGSAASIQLEKTLTAEREALLNNFPGIETVDSTFNDSGKNEKNKKGEKGDKKYIDYHLKQIKNDYSAMEKNYLREKKLKEMMQRTSNNMKYEINTLKNTIRLMEMDGDKITENNMGCVICFESIDSINKNCCSMPCGHRLHTTCMSKWIITQKHNASCPLCRDKLFKTGNENLTYGNSSGSVSSSSSSSGSSSGSGSSSSSNPNFGRSSPHSH